MVKTTEVVRAAVYRSPEKKIIASCLELPVSSAGSNLEEALDELTKDVQNYLISCHVRKANPLAPTALEELWDRANFGREPDRIIKIESKTLSYSTEIRCYDHTKK